MQNSHNKIISIILFGLLFSGCTTTTKEYRKFHGSFIADNEKIIFKRVKSENTLLEIYHFSGSVFPPGAFGGYSVFIEGVSDSFKEGRVIEIPNKEVQVSYYSDYHHLGKVDKNISGVISVKEVSEDYILLDVDITINRNQKRIKLAEKFKTYKMEKYEKQLP